MAEAAIPEPDRAEGCPHPRETRLRFGQGPAEAAYLQSVAAGRLHHAWALTGPAGIGKATLAWAMARHLAAGGRAPDLTTDPDSAIYRRSLQLAEPAIALVRRAWDDKAKRLKTQIGVEEIRKLQGHFTLSAADGGWRVAIIDAADEMTVAAANALLKQLEEPPRRAVLLLVCHRPAGLLPTIRSRCRTLPVPPLGSSDLMAALAALDRAVPDDPLLTPLSAGSVGEAVRLIDGGGLALYRQILALLGAMPGCDRGALRALCDAAAERGAAPTYAMILRLSGLALARMVRAGAGAPGDLGPEEAEIAARLVPGPDAAKRWSLALSGLEARQTHARAVNLDPAQVVLDLFTTLDRHAATILR